jgi:NOL1/NOP2/fmu family ribosome biogenesis protein
LNKKELRKILSIVDSQWALSVDGKVADGNAEKLLDYAFLMNSKNRIYFINRQVIDAHHSINLDSLRIDSIGLYFGELRDNELRLSMEATQLIGPYATKNVVEISDGLKQLWIRGFDIEVKEREIINCDPSSFVLVKNKNDFWGCGRLSSGKIINMTPKTRVIKSED